MIYVPDEIWEEIIEFIENHVDVVDGTDGPRPNRAMQLMHDIENGGVTKNPR